MHLHFPRQTFDLSRKSGAALPFDARNQHRAVQIQTSLFHLSIYIQYALLQDSKSPRQKSIAFVLGDKTYIIFQRPKMAHRVIMSKIILRLWSPKITANHKYLIQNIISVQGGGERFLLHSLHEISKERSSVSWSLIQANEGDHNT